MPHRANCQRGTGADVQTRLARRSSPSAQDTEQTATVSSSRLEAESAIANQSERLTIYLVDAVAVVISSRPQQPAISSVGFRSYRRSSSHHHPPDGTAERRNREHGRELRGPSVLRLRQRYEPVRVATADHDAAAAA
jgi:hypothetical protein